MPKSTLGNRQNVALPIRSHATRIKKIGHGSEGPKAPAATSGRRRRLTNSFTSHTLAALAPGREGCDPPATEPDTRNDRKTLTRPKNTKIPGGATPKATVYVAARGEEWADHPAF